MVQRRYTIWILLSAAVCLLALSFAPRQLWDQLRASKPLKDSQAAAHKLTLATPPEPDLYRFTEVDESAYQTPIQADPLVKEAELLAPAESNPAEMADRIASHVDEPVPAGTPDVGRTGPSLIAPATTPEASAPPAAETPAEKPAQGPPVLPLPEWARRLPAYVAGLHLPSLPELAGNGQSTGKTPSPSAAAPAASPVPQAKPLTIAVKPKQEKKVWPAPTALIEQLQQLSDDGPSDRWAKDVINRLQALGHAADADSDQSPAIVADLAKLERTAYELAAKAPDKAQARRLRRAGYALGRRLDLWEQIFQPGAPPIDDVIPVVLDPRKLSRCLAEIGKLTGDSAVGRAWRQFLMVGEIKSALALGDSPDAAKLRHIARKVMARMTQTPLTPAQQEFVGGKAVTALRDELRLWAAEPISPAALLAHVEALRADRTAQRRPTPGDGLPVSGRRRVEIAAGVVRPARSALSKRQFPHRLDRGIAQRSDPRTEPGVCAGRRHGARLSDDGGKPDGHRGRHPHAPRSETRALILEITGEIAANTTTDAGLARFHNKSDSYYIARKPIQVDLGGISLWPVEVKVRNETRLRDVNTSMDRVPLLNRVFEGVARSQAEQNKPAAEREVRGKVAARAKKRIDAEVHEKFAGVVERLNRRVFEPLNSLALDPELIEADTTKERLTMRLRLAGEDQLGSHTPRPRAPSDSLASVQLHETVLNNGIQRLQLAGRTFTLPELADHISARLSCPPPWETAPENQDVKITFRERTRSSSAARTAGRC